MKSSHLRCGIERVQSHLENERVTHVYTFARRFTSRTVPRGDTSKEEKKAEDHV